MPFRRFPDRRMMHRRITRISQQARRPLSLSGQTPWNSRSRIVNYVVPIVVQVLSSTSLARPIRTTRSPRIHTEPSESP